MNWDQAYANSDHIPDGELYPTSWAQAATQFRTQLHNGNFAVHHRYQYGSRVQEIIDFFRPRNTPLGIIVFVHGGYWMAFDPSFWSHLAQGAIARGWAFAIAGYPLCPSVRISDITQSIARAIQTMGDISDKNGLPKNLVLCGHSAGGHLVTRMLCSDIRFDEALRRRIIRVVSISGLHDLRPLLRTKMNASLKLDDHEAAMESPALQEPVTHAEVICCCGSDERPEFLRQSRLLANIWRSFGIATRYVEIPHRHHFDVIQDLTMADSDLTRVMVGLHQSDVM